MSYKKLLHNFIIHLKNGKKELFSTFDFQNRVSDGNLPRFFSFSFKVSGLFREVGYDEEAKKLFSKIQKTI
jgi:hypothetical protein